MSGRIKVEHGVWWLDNHFSDVHEVHKYEGTIWRGSPSLARVPKGKTSSPINAKYDPTDGVLFGVKYQASVHDDDGNFKHFYDDELLLHMTREEAIHMATTILNAATGSHL